MISPLYLGKIYLLYSMARAIAWWMTQEFMLGVERMDSFRQYVFPEIWVRRLRAYRLTQAFTSIKDIENQWGDPSAYQTPLAVRRTQLY